MNEPCIDGSCSKMKRAFFEVWYSIPAEDLDHLIGRVKKVVYFTGEDLGSWNNRTGEIGLNAEKLQTKAYEEIYKVVAHELSHAYCSWHTFKDERQLVSHEDEANRLARDWGFPNPEHENYIHELKIKGVYSFT